MNRPKGAVERGTTKGNEGFGNYRGRPYNWPMGIKILWAFFFALLSNSAFAADPSPPPAANVPNFPVGSIPGSVTYPAGSSPSGAPKPSIAVPTPDTIPPPSGMGGSTPSIPVPTTQPAQSMGKYRNAKGEVRLEDLLHDRYKQSVVRVVAKDLAGNVLAKAMGVGVGKNAQFIAAPLSLVLGSAQQWADRIEVTHFAGNKYEAKIALIDEEKNLVLLAPEANPAPIVFTREGNERPQIDVITISFDTAPDGTIASASHRGRLAAANPESGLLSVSPYTGEVIDDSQAGTGVIDSEGNLVGMLLPGGRGVLSSTLQKSIQKAQKATPIEPRMIGVILGRGVLVDASVPGAFKTISSALEAIKKGTAPKTDPTRYTPARNRAVAPKATDKVVVKVMPGTYKEPKPIVLPSDLSLSGSGPGQTVIVSPAPDKPAILVQNVSNVIVAGFRIVPAPLQKLQSPALIVSKGANVQFLGNVFEAKGGVAAWVHDSKNVSFFGNTFARGTVRGLSCDKSSLNLETNAFVGDWPIAVSLDKDCASVITRNLFFENGTSLSVAGSVGSTMIQMNTFVRSPAGVKIGGKNTRINVRDNVFFENAFGIVSAAKLGNRAIGRNAAWRSKFVAASSPITQVDIVRTEPTFEAPTEYDFRIQPGKGHTGSALSEEGADLGAYQRGDFLGPYSGTLARSLGSVTGQDDLAGAWGLAE